MMTILRHALINSPSSRQSVWYSTKTTHDAPEQSRQLHNLSPAHNTREIEDHVVDLDGLTILEADIIPDIRGGGARASLVQIRLA